MVIPLFAALLVAFAIVWGTVFHLTFAAVGTQSRAAYAHAAILLCGLTPIISWFLGGRKPDLDFLEVRDVPRVQGIWGQLSLVLLLGLAVSGALFWATARNHSPLNRRSLWWTYMAFVSGILLSMIGGTEPGFRYQLLCVPAMFLMVYVYLREDSKTCIQLIRRILLAYVWLSLLGILLAPSAVLDQGGAARNTLLPGLAERLVGITPHPNALGPAAAVALLLVLNSQRGWRRGLNATAAVVVLIATDSRVTMVGTLASLMVLFVYRQPRGRGPRLVLTALVVMIPLVSVLSVNSPAGPLASLSGGDVYAGDLKTVNGRTKVWAITMKEWRENPLLGYGPSLWDPEYRSQYRGLEWVGQAHNQFVQSVGDSGVVGFIGLLVYVAGLVVTGFRTAVRSRGLTLALVVLLLFRMLSESALRTPNLDVVAFLHLATFATVLVFIPRKGSDLDVPSRLAPLSSDARLPIGV